MRVVRICRCAGALAAIAVCACAPRAVESQDAPAGSAAVAEGISAYRVLRADREDVEVELSGGPGGRVVAHATATGTEQRLELPSGTVLSVRTSADRVSAVRGGVETALAQLRDGQWVQGARLDEEEGRAWRVLTAVDVDLAVQGTSVVSGGTRYVSCTAECIAAAGCARRARTTVAPCASLFVTCSACLEAEP